MSSYYRLCTYFVRLKFYLCLLNVCTCVALAAVSRKRQKRLEAEAAEEARIDREGIAVLRINLGELFGKNGNTEAWLSYPANDLKIFEVSASVSDTFLTEQLSKELNPMMLTVVKATGLPSTPLTHEQLRERYMNFAVEIHQITLSLLYSVQNFLQTLLRFC